MESSRIGSVNEGGELGLDCGGERRRVGVGLNSGTRSSEGAEVSRRLLGRGTDRHCRGSEDVVGVGAKEGKGSLEGDREFKPSLQSKPKLNNPLRSCLPSEFRSVAIVAMSQCRN